MKLGLIVGSLFVAGTAFAQAPGEVYGSDSGSAPGAESVSPPGMVPVAQPPPPPPPPVRERRWSVGLGIGGLSLSPHQSEESTDFNLGMIAVRWRPWGHLEAELAFSGGSESGDEYYDAPSEFSQAVFALRYRFNPLSKWNFWAMAGMGTMTVKKQYEDQGPSQSTLQFGGGLERRWTRFALQAELRIVGVAPVDQGDAPSVMVSGDVKTPGEPVPPNQPDSSMYGHGWRGGQFVLTGNFYF